MGRSRQIIIPIRARSRSIENVEDARLENSLAEFAQQTPHRRFQTSLLGTIICLELFTGSGVKSQLARVRVIFSDEGRPTGRKLAINRELMTRFREIFWGKSVTINLINYL